MMGYQPVTAPTVRKRKVLMSHQDLDARSLAMHRLVVDKLRRDPLLLERAKATLARWRAAGDASTAPYDQQWHEARGGGLEAVARLALDATRTDRVGGAEVEEETRWDTQAHPAGWRREERVLCVTLIRRDEVMPRAHHKAAPPPARISFAEVEREKQASRDADARDLASGRRSAEQLRRDNELFHGAKVRVDYRRCRDPR
jgi:hypothetical protein